MSSWWAAPDVQWDRAAFRKVAEAQWQRMYCDPEAAKVSSLISLRGTTAMGTGIRYAVNTNGEAA